jgi:antibiotic biosynthesis monooxygenase (ABM) superfamily enzyme
MSVTMRIIQRFKAPHEREFMAVEREFAALEASRPDYPYQNLEFA